VSHSFFGIQIAVQSPPGDPWREELRQLVLENQRDQAIIDKRAFYTRLTNLLNKVENKYALGHWDYIVGEGADREFDDWVAGLEATSAKDVVDPEEGGTGRDARELVVVSIVFLLEGGSNSDNTVAERCDLPESEWSARQTYVRLVATIRMLSFSSVQADGVYLVPGSVQDGLSVSDLQSEGWDYLKPMQ
jgi:hypothetical protein